MPAGNYTTSHSFSASGNFDYTLQFCVRQNGYIIVPDPLNVWLGCDSTGAYKIMCDAVTSGGTAPYTIRWYLNGQYLSSNDNQAHITSGCSANRVNYVRAVVSDAAGASRDESTSVNCGAYAE